MFALFTTSVHIFTLSLNYILNVIIAAVGYHYLFYSYSFFFLIYFLLPFLILVTLFWLLCLNQVYLFTLSKLCFIIITASMSYYLFSCCCFCYVKIMLYCLFILLAIRYSIFWYWLHCWGWTVQAWCIYTHYLKIMF